LILTDSVSPSRVPPTANTAPIGLLAPLAVPPLALGS